MFYALVYIEKGSTGRHMNTKTDVQAQLGRGDKTQDGKVIAGVGTAYESEQAMLRDKTLDKEINALRTAFKNRFILAALPGQTSSFVIDKYGEATAFYEEYRTANAMDPQVHVYITELELASPPNGVPTTSVSKWEQAIKDQILTVALGRKRDEVASSALDVFDALAKCPALSPETASELTKLAAQYRLGNMDKDEFQRSREKITVKVNTEILGNTPRAIAPIKRVVLPATDVEIQR